MRGFAKVLIALLILGGLFSYLVLPSLIENQLARVLQTGLGLQEEPEVEVSSDFPPELLLGRIDRVEATADQVPQQGFPLTNVRADVQGARVSVPGLLQGSPQVESESCSLTAEAPPVTMDCSQYLSY